MDFLKAEIESKKRSLNLKPDSSSSSTTSDQPPAKKYLKRSDLERIRHEQEQREAQEKEQRRKAKLYGTNSTPTSTSTSSSALKVPSSTNSPAPASPSSADSPAAPSSSATSALDPAFAAAAAVAATLSEEKYLVSDAEAIRRLRFKAQPIRLFGESDKDRRLRLRALELLERENESSGVAGQRNEMQRALEREERRAEVEEASKRGGGGGGGGGVAGSKPGSALPSRTGTPLGGEKGKGKAKEGTPLESSAAPSDADTPTEEKDAMELEVGDGNKEPNPKDEEVIVDLGLLKTNPHKLYPQVYHAFKRVLKEWEVSLTLRPESVKRSTQGKVAAATCATSAEYLKPLFRQLRKRDLPPDVLPNLSQIAHYMQIREYLKANDAYLRLSIGNAPWPIGVTMVGIHERSGREKIHSNNVAHVLNDETSRKYIQSLKRLLTFAQAVRPPDDVSQK
ncbi:hypothetical protein JCM11641_006514 [Rhodosporidiobolus odoratus]